MYLRNPELNLERAAQFSRPAGGPGACGWLPIAKTLLTVNPEREKSPFSHIFLGGQNNRENVRVP